MRIGRASARWSAPLTLLILVLVAAEALIALFDVPAYVLPRPSVVIATLWRDAPYFAGHLASTLRIMLLGTALAFAFSFVVGSVLAHSPFLSRGIFPVLVTLKLVPTVAIAPLIIIWFGFGLLSQIAVVILVVFFPMVVNIYVGIKDVDPDMVTLLRSQGANAWQVYIKLRVPHAVEYIFTSLRTAVPLSSIGAIVGEWVGASKGIGFIVKYDASLFRTPHVFASLLAIGLSGIALFLLVVWAEFVFSRR